VVDTDETTARQGAGQENQMTTTNTSPAKLSRNARQYRAWVRQQTGRALPGEPVVVVEGDAAPRSLGESYYWTTRGGQRISHPNAYARKGRSNMVYRGSTNRTEVGAAWLAARGISVAEIIAA
jgi:hypothetical protein